MAENNELVYWDIFWKKEKTHFSRTLIDFMKKNVFCWLISKYLGQYTGKNVLEAGCGSSETLVYIVKKANHVVGLDYSKSAIELSTKNFQKAKINPVKYTLFQGDIHNMPFLDNEFDIVFNTGVVEHVDSVKAIREMLRVAKKGGKVVILVPAKKSITIGTYNLLKAIGLANFYPWDVNHKFYTKLSFRKELQAAGVRNFSIGHPISLWGIYIVAVCQK